MNKFLTVKDIATLFNISITTVYRLMETRQLPFLKIGGMYRFSEEMIEEYLETNKWDWSQHPKLKV